MSEWLQVTLTEEDLGLLERAANAAGQSLSEWAIRTLRAAAHPNTATDAAEKMTAVARASQNAFPAPDIDEMLREIDAGCKPTQSS